MRSPTCPGSLEDERTTRKADKTVRRNDPMVLSSLNHPSFSFPSPPFALPTPVVGVGESLRAVKRWKLGRARQNLFCSEGHGRLGGSYVHSTSPARGCEVAEHVLRTST